MAVAATPMTAEQYLALPEQHHTQLIDGEIVVTEPTLRHQRIAFQLAYLLKEHAERHPGLGEAGIPVNVVIDERNVFGPDVWWVAEARRPSRTATRFDRAEVLPDLVAEVRSPSTWRYDVGTKKASYERSGLAELWLVDTEAEVIRVFRRSSPEATGFDVAFEVGAGEALSTDLVPGFALDVATLFDR